MYPSYQRLSGESISRVKTAGLLGSFGFIAQALIRGGPCVCLNRAGSRLTGPEAYVLLWQVPAAPSKTQRTSAPSQCGAATPRDDARRGGRR